MRIMDVDKYFDSLSSETYRAYEIAKKARALGLDPVDDVEIALTKDVASRVEGLLELKGIGETIRNLEKAGKIRFQIAVEMTKEIAGGKLLNYNTSEKRIDMAVRVGVAILTEGVLVAPTEGIVKVELNKNEDNTQYASIYFAGPIRSAGATIAAMSVILTDVARIEAGIGTYKPTEEEINRTVEEIELYNSRVAHLQYHPPEEHIRIIYGNCPICIDGESTSDEEVSVYRNLPRIKTNRVRGGVPLVICEGMAQKSAKLKKYIDKLKLKDWDWFSQIIKVKQKGEKVVEVKPDWTYLEGIIAGRPIFAYPSRKGAFRLRYGRSFTNGIMAKNLHPATMIILDDFIACGTHLKMERPGKGAVFSGVDSLEPPVVKLKSGDVVKVKTIEQALQIRDSIAEIIFLGDMLCAYGDFLKSNNPLMPAGYCSEWWILDVKAKGIDVPNLATAKEAFDFAKKTSTPLHPDFLSFWKDISKEELGQLIDYVASGYYDGKNLNLKKKQEKRILELLCLEHKLLGTDVVVEGENAVALLMTLGAYELTPDSILKNRENLSSSNSNLEFLSSVSGVEIRDKAGTYIGGKMGRPEKAKERILNCSPNVLFPSGKNSIRSLTKLYQLIKSNGKEKVTSEMATFKCVKCGKINGYRKCVFCGSETTRMYKCSVCGRETSNGNHCDKEAKPYADIDYDFMKIYDLSREKLGFSSDDIKGVEGLMSSSKIPERLEKGFLRAKHGVYIFKDGTSRFDATDMPLTHFIPKDIDVSVEKLKSLGYETDYLGKPLEDDSQIVPLMLQDIVLSDNGAKYLTKVANFLDDMLVHLYGLEPFYKIEKKEDLIGHLVIGLSPHTSAGVIGRIIGFTKANVGYAHPFYQTAKRRNCFNGGEKLMVHDGKGLRLITMRELVETRLNGKCKQDDFGTTYKGVAGLKTFAFNKNTNKFELAKITHISRHLAPSSLIELKTKSGRTIRATPDHDFPDRNGNKVKAKDAEEVLIPWNLPDRATKDIKLFDMLSLAGQDAMIRTEEPVFESNISKISKDLNISYKTLTNYIYRKSYPLWIVKKFKPSIIKGRKFLLSSRRDSISMKPSINIDESLLSLIGFYLAEGYIKKRQRDTQQVSIAATKPWAKKYLVKTIHDAFGLDASVSKNSVTMCSGYALKFFKQLGIGDGAYSKRIPDFVYSMPKNKIAAFLRGYFSGDGSCSLGSTLEVNVTSVNKELIDGTSVLLNLLGIRHSIQKQTRSINSDIIMRFYKKPKDITEFKVRIYGEAAMKFIEDIGFLDQKQERAKALLKQWIVKRRKSRAVVKGDVFIDPVISRKSILSNDKYVYNLTVEKHHNLVCSGITAFQCDGDEDAVMLLMDGFINFSKKFLSSNRGGTMDAPLVLSIILNPKEVDDESHNMEIVENNSYTLDLYEAGMKFTMPGDLKMKTIADILETKDVYGEIPFTHKMSSISLGPTRTKYVQLKSIPEKIAAQVGVMGKIRSLDMKDAIEKLILSHFIPDIYGNLRKFSRQSVRCKKCNTIHRRVPLNGKCMKCGGDLLLTIYQGTIEKYLEIAKKLSVDYSLPLYMIQRLDLVGKEIDSVFNAKSRQKGIGDFM
ncbi:MAG: DNA polymerase II large subunit [Candidatus Micrarchaeota archaeon]|nr:DNA polymerase II large subunit [Candidatus Micrarchaeota archaeon]